MSDVSDRLNAMIAGTDVDEEVQETEEVEEVESVKDEVVEEESTETADIEDTDQEEDADEEEDTEGDADEDDQETSEESDDNEEEDTHGATEETDVEEEVEENTEEETKEAVEPSYDYKGVDLKKFYEEVAEAKFTANGREVEGFKDPQDLIRAQQMLHGYSDKMKVFKDYKKFFKPLEERGITSDPDKFNLAMSLIDGDEEAIKKVIKDRGMDPLEFDLDNVNYISKNTLPSEERMLIEEVSSQAKDLGIDDKFNKALSNDFDDASLDIFVNAKNEHIRNNLLAQLKDGTYDTVQNEVKRMEMLDYSNKLGSLNTIEKYNLAASKLYEANNPKAPQEQKEVVDNSAKDKAKELADAAEFKRKAAVKEKEVADQRKKAASVSKKRVVKVKSKEVKPEELSGPAFRDAFRDMMMS